MITERLIKKRLIRDLTVLSDEKIALHGLDKKSFNQGYGNGYVNGFIFGLFSTIAVILTSELLIFLLYKIITI